MRALNTYLTSLRDMIFKLLPMREEHDEGTENHIGEYIENLYANYAGAFACYPELEGVKEVVEVYNNIAFLKDNEVEFARWRSMVLRSTRLIQSVALKYEEVQDMG